MRVWRAAPERVSAALAGNRALHRGPPLLPHFPTKRKPLPWQGFNEALFLARIADRTPDGIKPRRQRCIGHAAPVPDGVNEIVFADDALAVADQVFEQIEHLRRDGDGIRSAMQLPPVRVKCVVLEEIAQTAIP